MLSFACTLVSRRVGVAFAAAVVAMTSVPAAQDAGGAQAVPGRRFALLVGVTEFTTPAMKKHSLEGPANDVALFRTLLTREGFDVPPANIVSLAGLPADESARPTRANIEREFRALRDAVRPGDHVVVLLAGHGSQQPANPDPTDEEPDGLDEIFLPADAAGWDGASSRVTNAIVDDDVRLWVNAIRNGGAIVWLIVDSCHSGTMTRAAGSRWRERGIPPDALIPASALAAARSRTTTAPERPAFELSASAADIAALYAADMTERTPELPMPDRNGPVHGLFTYTLARLLMEHPGPVTYRELVQRVIDRYQSEGFGPTPALEGAGIDREVLGERSARSRTTFAFEERPRGSRWTLAAGSIHGLTPGSILELLPPSGPATPFGYVKVVDVHPASAIVEPTAFEKLPAPAATAVSAGSRARVKYHEFGALTLRVALQRAVTPSGGSEIVYEVVPPGRGPATLERALGSLRALSNGLAQRVDSSDADWFVRVSENRVILVPAREPMTIRPRSGAQVTGPSKRFDVGDIGAADLPDALARQLGTIARATNLARLSTYVDPEARLQLSVLKDRSDGKRTPILPAEGNPIVKAGEHLQFVVRNGGGVPLDVTLLYIDANYGVWELFPDNDSLLDNRVEPGQERRLAPREINADPVGWESVVAIGVESTLRHQNFLSLAQPSLPEMRSASDGPPSPLRLLLESAVFGTRSSQSAPLLDRGRFAVTQTWFLVEPSTR
jgi:hypothetical protein